MVATIFDHCYDLIKSYPGIVVSLGGLEDKFPDGIHINDYSLITAQLEGKVDAIVYPGNLRLPVKGKTVFVNHGTSDKQWITTIPASNFDLILVPGRRDFDRLSRHGESGNIKIVGYLKFDRLAKGVSRKKFFDNGKPVILFAPSWSAESGNFAKTVISTKKIVESCKKAGCNVIIKHHPFVNSLIRGAKNFDFMLGMENSDSLHVVKEDDAFPYLAASDMLITGTSAVSYEALYFDIPSVFLDLEQVIPEYDNIDSPGYVWQTGYVCTDLEGLSDLVMKSLEDPKRFSQVRKEIFEYSFLPPDGKACERALDEIRRIL